MDYHAGIFETQLQVADIPKSETVGWWRFGRVGATMITGR